MSKDRDDNAVRAGRGNESMQEMQDLLLGKAQPS